MDQTPSQQISGNTKLPTSSIKEVKHHLITSHSMAPVAQINNRAQSQQNMHAFRHQPISLHQQRNVEQLVEGTAPLRQESSISMRKRADFRKTNSNLMKLSNSSNPEDTKQEDNDRNVSRKTEFNAKLMNIRVLVVGIEGSGQEQILEKYGVQKAQSTKEDNFNVSEVQIEDEFYQLNIKFYDPLEKEIKAFTKVFVERLKNKEFDGILMVCAHRDMEGDFLKQSIEYLGDLQQSIIMNQLPPLPKVVLVNNEMKVGGDEQEISSQAYQFTDPKLRLAKQFAKKSLKCLAFKINQLAPYEKMLNQIEVGINEVVEQIVQTKEGYDPYFNHGVERADKDSIKQSFVKLKNMTTLEKLRYIYRLLVITQCLTSLTQAFISVKLSISIQSYLESWLCNANNLSGFFCFFGAVIGFYGVKFNNKEYLKTYQMTSITDIMFNLEAILLFVILLGVDHDHIIEVHYRYMWVNFMQFFLSTTAFTTSCFVRKGIVRQMRQQVAESAAIVQKQLEIKQAQNLKEAMEERLNRPRGQSAAPQLYFPVVGQPTSQWGANAIEKIQEDVIREEAASNLDSDGSVSERRYSQQVEEEGDLGTGDELEEGLIIGQEISSDDSLLG